MAINRYTQPIQDQVISTSPDPNLLLQMKQKRAAEESQVDQNMFQMESTLAGIQAYGDEDSRLLNQKRDQYNKRLQSLYDQYADNPNLMLQNMKSINKEFLMDVQSGELADISKKYGIAQADIQDAKERYGKGDLNVPGMRAQIENAGTGFRAQKDSGMFNEFTDNISTTDYSEDAFNGNQALAEENAVAAFKRTYGEQLSYMNEAEYTNAINNARNIFRTKWRADKETAAGNIDTNEALIGRRGVARLNPNVRKGLSIADADFDGDGNYIGRLGQEAQMRQQQKTTMQVDYGIGQQTADQTNVPLEKKRSVNQEQVAAITQFRDTYGLPENMTDQEVSKLIIQHDDSNRASFVENTMVSKSDSINSLVPSLVEALPGGTAWIDGQQESGDVMQKVADAFGMSKDELLKSNLLEKATTKTLSGVGKSAGTIVYSIETNDGVMNIEVATNIEDLTEATTPSWTLGNAIINGKTGDVDGIHGVDEKSGQAYSGVEIIGDYDSKKKTLSEAYVLYTRDEDGEKVYLRDDEGLRITTSYESLRAADLEQLRDKVSETKIKPKYN